MCSSQQLLEVGHAGIIIAISSIGLLKLRGQHSYLAEVLQMEERLRSFVCLLLQSAKLKILEMTVSILTRKDVRIEGNYHVRINQ